MKAIHLACGILVLAITPVMAFAQAGTTPLLTIPETLTPGANEFGGYFTIEDNLDLFGVYRRGVNRGFDFGLRGGFTDAGGGGVTLGGDLRFQLSRGSEELPLAFAVVGSAQASFFDTGWLLAFPFGVSLGWQIDAADRPLWLYGLPYLIVQRSDPNGAPSNTEVDFGVEVGGQLWLASKLWLVTALTIQNDVALALGLNWRAPRAAASVR